MAADVIDALGSFAWPVLVALLLFRVSPYVPSIVHDLREALKSRAFTVKVGAAELSVQEASDEIRKKIADL